MAFEAMFEPIQIGKLTIRNRVLSTAHAEVYATDGGMTTARYVQYYEEKAKGGIGLAICGGSSVVAIDSPQEWWSSVGSLGMTLSVLSCVCALVAGLLHYTGTLHKGAVR